MKIIRFLLQIIMLAYLCSFMGHVSAQDNKKITHVVMVWLKQPGNEQQRSAFLKASEQLNDLPGIVNRHVGVVVSSDRGIVDDTFDVAVSVTLENQAALTAYLNNPKHKKILNEKIKPLINRTVAYDFISQ